MNFITISNYFLYCLKRINLKKIKSKIEIDIVEINYNNVDLVKTIRENSHINAFKKMLSKFEKGYYAIDKSGNLIGHFWADINYNATRFTYNKNKLKKNEVFFHYCFVAESARGNNIYPYSLYYISDKFFNNEINSIIIDIDKYNIPSQKGIEKVGFIKKYNNIIFKIRSRIIISIKTKTKL